ncbi:MAG TPA: YgjV family protein [Williamwhitmania sp.]|jgi:hypothetical protein|nr:YgjV family protein [Williamwhitmania sp.]
MGSISFVELLGYVASIITAISLLMSSIIKLRWFNLFGSLVFSIYGFVILAYPVALFNGFIVFVNIYYLYKIYSRKEFFNLQRVDSSDGYFTAFQNFFRQEIAAIFPEFKIGNHADAITVLVLRNMAVAGVFIGEKQSSDTLKVVLDFVIPEYRDFKMGRFVYRNNTAFFESLGIKQLVAETGNATHLQYLKKMGFTEADVLNGQTQLKMVL